MLFFLKANFVSSSSSQQTTTIFDKLVVAPSLMGFWTNCLPNLFYRLQSYYNFGLSIGNVL